MDVFIGGSQCLGLRETLKTRNGQLISNSYTTRWVESISDRNGSGGLEDPRAPHNLLMEFVTFL